MAVSVFGEMTAAGELGLADNFTTWTMASDAELATVRGRELNIIIRRNKSGAVAIGPDAFAAADVSHSFNTFVRKVSLSRSILRQSISGSSVVSGPGGSPTLTTGPITATIGGENLGVITANMNTGIANQGAAVSISIISSSLVSSP